MNLREKFLWNLTVVISFIILLWNGWGQYSTHSNISRAFNKYESEEIGTDKELQNMVSELEKNLNKRQSMKFKSKYNPLGLTNVISLDGNLNSRGVKGIECRAVISNGDGSFSSECYYKSKRYLVTVGDSIGGGIINDISSRNLILEKDDQIIMFNFFD